MTSEPRHNFRFDSSTHVLLFSSNVSSTSSSKIISFGFVLALTLETLEWRESAFLQPRKGILKRLHLHDKRNLPKILQMRLAKNNWVKCVKYDQDHHIRHTICIPKLHSTYNWKASKKEQEKEKVWPEGRTRGSHPRSPYKSTERGWGQDTQSTIPLSGVLLMILLNSSLLPQQTGGLIPREDVLIW